MNLMETTCFNEKTHMSHSLMWLPARATLKLNYDPESVWFANPVEGEILDLFEGKMEMLVIVDLRVPTWRNSSMVVSWSPSGPRGPHRFQRLIQKSMVETWTFAGRFPQGNVTLEVQLRSGYGSAVPVLTRSFFIRFDGKRTETQACVKACVDTHVLMCMC